MRAPAAAPRQRLNRYLAGRGVASRRGADLLIEAGRVAVNGRRAELGMLVDPVHDGVAVDGRPVPPEVEARTLMINKPVGVVSTRSDPGGRPTVLDLVDDAAGLFPVGRLDADSRGLLLLTTDGELALRLTHPRHGIRKRYLVALRGRVPAAALRTIVAGVHLEDGPARALSAAVTGDRQGDTVIEVEMGEGRRREVRRLCAAAGLHVTDLQRVGFGPLRLGRLAEGGSRRLRPSEEAELRAATGLAEPADAGGRG
ncbi:MAG TPA: pseudouridine synthase [Candidatus Dormibacteraeota bacterium]|nr:pseudouridine synthase [Candidatus Dormibacteraeota bacterium]